MKTNIVVLLTGFLALSFTSYAQCDPKLYDKMGKELKGTIFLKRYAIESKEVGNIPFVREYSYVLSKNRTYVFNMENSTDTEGQFEFTLLDSNGNILNEHLATQEIDHKKVLVFECIATGIYRYSIHSSKSFNGCAILQLSFLRESQNKICDLSLNSKLEKPYSKGATFLKRYSLVGKERLEYSYVFSKNNTYYVYIQNGQANNGSVSLNILDNEKKTVDHQITKEEVENGILYTFQCNVTGIYYLDFELNGGEVCAIAQLSSKRMN